MGTLELGCSDCIMSAGTSNAMSDASTGRRPLRDASNALTEEEFNLFRQLLSQETGIELDAKKRPFVAGRLASRLALLNIPSYRDYYRLIAQPDNDVERLQALDLLTTHETWFFREGKHFEKLRAKAMTHRADRPFRVWSAACASGEEAYSIGMVLADVFGAPSQRWEVLATDISTSGLEAARHGRYPLSRAEAIPRALLHRFCRKGVRSQEGMFMVSRELRAQVRFDFLNLFRPFPDLPVFDIIFLRNTLIYFKPAGRQQILNAIEPHLAEDGLLLVSHTESLQGLDSRFALVKPGIYRKPEIRS